VEEEGERRRERIIGRREDENRGEEEGEEKKRGKKEERRRSGDRGGSYPLVGRLFVIVVARSKARGMRHNFATWVRLVGGQVAQGRAVNQLGKVSICTPLKKGRMRKRRGREKGGTFFSSRSPSPSASSSPPPPLPSPPSP
jgi:hypothetical protein